MKDLFETYQFVWAERHIVDSLLGLSASFLRCFEHQPQHLERKNNLGTQIWYERRILGASCTFF